MSEAAGTVLLIGYGNPGRLDDGLGPALADAVEAMALPGVTVDADYQLTVEDATAVAAHDVVIFADATVLRDRPFSFRRIDPKAGLRFSSHSVEPEAVLALARQLFNATTIGYVLAIRGHAFNEFGEYLSEPAQVDLARALQFLTPLLKSRAFDAAAEACDDKLADNDASMNEDEPWKMENT